VRGAQELHKSANNTGLDNTFNRRIALLGEQLSEFGCSLNLRLNLVGEDALDHLRELHVELKQEFFISHLFIFNATKKTVLC
jgi:hypothetical protein